MAKMNLIARINYDNKAHIGWLLVDSKDQQYALSWDDLHQAALANRVHKVRTTGNRALSIDLPSVPDVMHESLDPQVKKTEGYLWEVARLDSLTGKKSS